MNNGVDPKLIASLITENPDVPNYPPVDWLDKTVNLVDATLEMSDANKNGDAVTLYFDGVPTESQVREVCKNQISKLPLGVDTNDPHFSFVEVPSPISKRAGLYRYQVYPTV